MTTMADLRRECVTRLRETLHGRNIDMLEKNVTTAHMLGIVPIGVRSNHEVEEGTLLDPEHEFWSDFEEDVNTKGKAKRQIESAIRSLKKEDVLRMTYPYGEDADIVYCEVDELGEADDVLLPTTCAECEHTIDAELSLEYGDSYSLQANIDCPHCEFDSSVTFK